MVHRPKSIFETFIDKSVSRRNKIHPLRHWKYHDLKSIYGWIRKLRKDIRNSVCFVNKTCVLLYMYTLVLSIQLLIYIANSFLKFFFLGRRPGLLCGFLVQGADGNTKGCALYFRCCGSPGAKNVAAWRYCNNNLWCITSTAWKWDYFDRKMSRIFFSISAQQLQYLDFV